MKATMTVSLLLLFLCSGVSYASGECRCASRGDPVTKTVGTVTDTAQSAAGGTACIAQTSVANTAETPKVAIQSVKDTANTALNSADKAIKAFTGECD